MSQLLTTRQAEELCVSKSLGLALLFSTNVTSHKAIIAYLSSTNLSRTAALLREEADIGEGFDDATSKKYEGLLEKKWTSVVRLQKKVGHCNVSLGHAPDDDRSWI